MPKLEPKVIQKELDAGKVRPVYLIAGPERMRSREMVKKIQKTVFRDATANDFNFERLDASEASISRVIDSVQSPALTGEPKLILVRNVEDWRDLDPLAAHLESQEENAPHPVGHYPVILVLVSTKPLDGRKKASKSVTEGAAVVASEAIPEEDREAWIDFLVKRRGSTLSDSERLSLRGLDPWSLDLVEQELLKLDLVGGDEALRAEALRSGVSAFAQDQFLDALFTRDRKRALELVHLFSVDHEVQILFTGLLAWNLRHLKLLILEEETRSPSAERRNPRLLSNLKRWRRFWTRSSIQDFEHRLFEMDLALKGSRMMGLGLWNSLILNSSRSPELKR